MTGRRRPHSRRRGPGAAAQMATDPRIIRVLAPNPGPMTLEGTNTWIVGARPSLVIDPGPDDPAHIEAVARAAGRVGAIGLTHRHPDHALGSARLAERTGAPVFAFHPERDEQRLLDGQPIDIGDVHLTAVHTPGHSRDHVAFYGRASGALFTGDAVLGRGTSVIDPPEGDVAQYMRSLEIMIALRPRTIYPGHGPAVWSAERKLDEYRQHRRLREEQIVTALKHAPSTPDELVQRIYEDYRPELHPLAARSVLAHLLKLEREGRAARVGALKDNRFEASAPTPCRRCGRPALARSSLCRRCQLEVLQEAPSAAVTPSVWAPSGRKPSDTPPSGTPPSSAGDATT